MRVAFLLHGKIGGMAGKDGAGGLIDYRFCCDKFYENIIEPNNADVFLHSWSKEQEDDLMEIYSPKKAVIEKQRGFPINRSLPLLGDKGNLESVMSIIKSRFYSSQKVISLKSEYEKENKFKYDFVFISRFDLIWHTPLIFENLDPSYFYVANWSKTHHPLTGKIRRFLDLYFASNSQYIDYYGEAFERLKIANAGDPHTFIKEHLEDYPEIMNKIKLMGHRVSDFDVYRDRVESYKNGRTVLK